MGTSSGRDLVIRALAVKDRFNTAEHELLMSLVRSVGLFPYMTGQLAHSDFEDYLAYELHRADNMGEEIVFHSLQARIYHQLMSGGNVVLSASTSVGKSLIIDALIASGKYKNIVVVVPTIALIDELRRRLVKRFKHRCAVITHAMQQAQPDHINIYVLTQERVLSRDDLDKVDLFILDEFYKLNLTNDPESDRAVDLNLAFNRLLRTGAQFYLLGPNVQKITGLDRYEYHFIPSGFSTVAVDVVNMNLPTRGDQRGSTLLDLCRELGGPTIIYCQSPRSASEVATALAKTGDLPILEATADAVSWMADRYHPDWPVCDSLRHGIAVHHGGVPRALQQYFIQLFNNRKIPFLVCTSTIIEGVNTVAQNVIVYDRRKSTAVLDHFTYKNIQGRAGRMREYFIGKVYILESPPPEEEYAVQCPVGLQHPETPLSLLLDLHDSDLAQVSRDRLTSLFENSSLSPATLRLNRHVPIKVQEAIAARIRISEMTYRKGLIWRALPDGPQLRAVCELIFEFLEERVLRDYGVYSGGSLAWHVNKLRMERDLSAYVKHNVESRLAGQRPGEAVESSLKLVRNVICQRFPRDLMVIDAIQRDVFVSSGVEPGEYALFAQQAESLFLPPAIFALDEYGVPIQTAQRLAPHLLPASSLDDVLSRLLSLQLDDLDLSPFERAILEDMRAAM